MKKVPKLRFKEFEKEWEEKKIGDITNLTAGGTPNTLKKEYWNGNIKWMNSGELNLKFIYDVQGRITELGLKNSSTKLIPEKCILIGLAGQGKTRGTVAINFIELCTNQSIASIFPNFNYFKPMFLYYNLDNRYEELRNLSTGSNGRGGLNLNILKRISVFFPILKEQEKIADFLSSVDVKINLTENKLELLKEYKKGIMQKIFNQELRFKDSNGNDYPEWEEKKLGDITKFSKGKLISKEDITDTGVECIRYGELYTTYNEVINKVVSKTNLDISTLVLSEKNDIIIPCSGETAIDIAKASCVTKSGVALGGDLNILKLNENGIFLSYYLNNKAKYQIVSLAQGASVVHLYEDHLKKLKIKVPILQEQQKIADFLSAIDSKIEKISDELENLKEFKKGLFQQMFV